MSTKSVTVRCEGYFSFQYDPDSKEFQDTLESYRSVIHSEADEYDVIKQCAAMFIRGKSVEEIIEGVGRLKLHRDKKVPDTYSGISVADDEPDFEIEID